MRMKWTVLAAAIGICGAALAPAGFAAAEQTAQQVINDLQSKGYTVTIDRIGSGPMADCTVTDIRNPQTVSQLVPYLGPGRGGNDRTFLVPQVTSQTISVSLNCSR